LSSQEVTCSTIIDFAEKLEDYSSSFYEKLAARFPENEEQFLSFVEESERNKILIRRTYEETITDALEACFCFKGVNLGDYAILVALQEDLNCFAALKLAIDNEQKAVRFYSSISDLSKGLLGTIPMAFRKVAERRKSREMKLRVLANRV
jgi:rubrerythrin